MSKLINLLPVLSIVEEMESEGDEGQDDEDDDDQPQPELHRLGDVGLYSHDVIMLSVTSTLTSPH